jgi:2-methylcitrate dehydratase PrpD
MDIERTLARFASEARFEDLPRQAVEIGKQVIRTIVATTVAGAAAEGCQTLVTQVKEWGGREEATVLIEGGKVPAHSAAMVNSVMARALDFCDAMSPGIHIGASSVPTALAASELVGGCSGKDFLAALVIGSEVAARLNLSRSTYDGFDPTGVCTVFATAVIAGRMLRLDAKQMHHALALAFNRSGGSFQSNVDGSLAVRIIQGWVSQSGILCAQLAQKGLTGPHRFLEGVYGYFHLFARDKYDPDRVTGGLGETFEMTQVLFKKYPSCGGTLSSTDLTLQLVQQEGLVPEKVARIDVKVVPYIYKIVGHPFRIGENPKVNAQFSIQYCVANSLLRKSSKLMHFDVPAIRDPKVLALLEKIHMSPDPALDERGHNTACELTATLHDGTVYRRRLDVAPGFPENPLKPEEHEERFWDCISYSGNLFRREDMEGCLSLVNSLEEVEDVTACIVPLLVKPDRREPRGS